MSMGDPDDISESMRDAYRVLYEVEKKRGNAPAALSYFEHYAAQDKGYLDNVSAKALAYQVVQQHVLAKKLESEELNKQNNILRLQQALDTKAVETSRLYITLLLRCLPRSSSGFIASSDRNCASSGSRIAMDSPAS